MSIFSHFEKVAGPFPGEANGVIWDGDGVLFSLKDDSRLMHFNPSSREVKEVRKYTNRVNGIARGPQGQLYGAQEGGRRLVEFMPDGRMTEIHAKLDGLWHNQPTHLIVDVKGRIWFCDPHSDVLPFGPRFFPPLEHASVLRLWRNDRHDWVVQRITYDTLSPRALALSNDGKFLFVAEGEAKPQKVRQLRAYPFLDDSLLGAPKVLMSFPEDGMGPHRGIEGLCISSEGHLIACGGWMLSGPGPAVYVFGSDGRLLSATAFPADRPNQCCLDSQGRRLFVTTAGGELYMGSRI